MLSNLALALGKGQVFVCILQIDLKRFPVFRVPGKSILTLTRTREKIKKFKWDIHYDDVMCILCLLHLYPGFYSYTDGVTWTILDLITETLLMALGLNHAFLVTWLGK